VKRLVHKVRVHVGGGRKHLLLQRGSITADALYLGVCVGLNGKAELFSAAAALLLRPPPRLPLRLQLLNHCVQRLSAVCLASLHVDGAQHTNGAAAVRAECPQMLLRVRGARDLWLRQQLRQCSASATSTRSLALWGRRHWHAVLLAPISDQIANSDVCCKVFVVEGLVGEGRHVVRFHPQLNRMALVRDAIRCHDRLSHEFTVEHHVAQMICGAEWVQLLL
jgi:hypothetical protein